MTHTALFRANRYGLRSQSFLTNRTDLALAQGEAIEILRDNGAEVAPWPTELLRPLQEATGPYLDGRAEALDGTEAEHFRRILNHMRNYLEDRAVYFAVRDAPRDLD